ncbi:hypothetical protein [Enterobacter hormaechei]|uniref:hypothetical protein n=1 Tax=Enterobacter hormaechei TaxID=158836 RepID=UPI001E5F6385
MPKQLKPLTNVEIAGAKPRGTDYELRDGEGLYLLVKTSVKRRVAAAPYPAYILAGPRKRSAAGH